MAREAVQIHVFNLSVLTTGLGGGSAAVRPVVQPRADVWRMESTMGRKKKKERDGKNDKDEIGSGDNEREAGRAEDMVQMELI